MDDFGSPALHRLIEAHPDAVLETHARLGDEAVARKELEALRVYVDEGQGGEEGRAIVREIEAILEGAPIRESTPSSSGDG